MAEFLITGPDNQTYRITGPEGATEEQALARVQALVKNGREIPSSGGSDATTRITVNPVAADQPAASEQPNVGAGTAALEGLLSGASANFRDEIYGASEASGLPKILGGFRAPIGAARMLYEAATEPGEATKTYEEAVAQKRAEQETAQRQYPGTTLAGNVAGAVMLPGGALLQGATLPARIAGGVALGGGYGALAGAGEGTTPADRGMRAATGGITGGLLGGAGVPAVEGLARLGGAVLSRPINMIRAAVNPQGAAERAIGTAQQQAVRADPQALNRLLPANVAPGQPAVVMDVLGQPGRNLARSAKNLSGEASDVLHQVLEPRFEAQAPRLVNWLRQTFHYPDVHAQQQAIQATAKTVNDPNYRRAMMAGRNGIWDQELADIAGAPPMQDAIKKAIRSAQTKSAPDVSKGMQAISERWYTKDQKPTLEFWDLVKRQLDPEITTAVRNGHKEDVADLTNLKNALLAKLDAAVPEYRAARSGAAHFFDADDALQAGMKFVDDTKPLVIGRTKEAIAAMSPTERQLFQDGFVSRFSEVLSRTGKDRSDVTRQVFNSQDARDKFELALGPQRAREFEAILRVENIMQQAQRGVAGNSTTAMQIIGAGLAGAGGGGYLGFDPTASGFAAALATAGKKGIDQRVATRIGHMLVSDDTMVLQRAARALARSPALMAALRNADNSAAKIGAQQAPKNIFGLQAAGVGRTDEDQPAVPGPPGQ